MQTCREEWFQPLQTRRKVPGRDILAGRAAGQVLAGRPSIGVVPPVLPQPSGAVENTLATCAYIPGIPTQILAGAVAALSRHTSRGVSRLRGRDGWTGIFSSARGPTV